MAEKEMKATREELQQAGIKLESRDYCAHLLIPLNKCRRKTLYLPWKCVDERHTYEACEYELFLERVKKMDAIKAAAAAPQH
jgi:NADH dehydrogenase (ubiquinone) 1 beta subcomplex subunit 7